jgi:hypothetical protein
LRQRLKRSCERFHVPTEEQAQQTGLPGSTLWQRGSALNVSRGKFDFAHSPSVDQLPEISENQKTDLPLWGVAVPDPPVPLRNEVESELEADAFCRTAPFWCHEGVLAFSPASTLHRLFR